MTEPGIIHQMKKATPQKEFMMGPDLEGCSCNECPHMKLNTHEKLVTCLEKEEPEIRVPEALQSAALKPLQKMVEMTEAPI